MILMVERGILHNALHNWSRDTDHLDIRTEWAHSAHTPPSQTLNRRLRLWPNPISNVIHDIPLRAESSHGKVGAWWQARHHCSNYYTNSNNNNTKSNNNNANSNNRSEAAIKRYPSKGDNSLHPGEAADKLKLVTRADNGGDTGGVFISGHTSSPLRNLGDATVTPPPPISLRLPGFSILSVSKSIHLWVACRGGGGGRVTLAFWLCGYQSLSSPPGRKANQWRETEAQVYRLSGALRGMRRSPDLA
ncbi:hypothetical protein EGW08_005231 [Elysia chlorotica]|uniref:Uncharacterized protein n=1 Tax=Elysia chlorotica TaxID=188477 RepID=A0A433TZI9_ELYCH|nr:hypothetical protein EGW08_005231 [Elysia chlorotica]